MRSSLVAGGVVGARAFQEELALLGKEQGKAGEVDLPIVGLRLGKVGVHGQDGGEVGRDVLGDVQAGFPLAVVLFFAPGGVGPELPAFALLQSLEAGEQACLGEVGDPHVLPRRGPAVLLLLPLDLSLDVQAPGGLSRLEAEGLEGNGQLGRPPALGPEGRRIPDPVPVVGRVLLVVRDLPVASRPRRVDLEEEAVALVEEGVHQDGDRVVDLQHRVTGELGGHDGPGLAVVADDAQVEVVRVVEHADLGLFRGGLPLVGYTLDEGADGRGQGPGSLVEPSVELDPVRRAEGDRLGHRGGRGRFGLARARQGGEREQESGNHPPSAATILSARAWPSWLSNFSAGQSMPRPVSSSLGMMWKCTWNTAWCAAAPLFWSTL